MAGLSSIWAASAVRLARPPSRARPFNTAMPVTADCTRWRRSRVRVVAVSMTGSEALDRGMAGRSYAKRAGVHGDSGRCHTVACGLFKVNPHSIITQCVYDLRKTENTGPGSRFILQETTCPAPALPLPCASPSAR
ncbi:protein of unknown function [Cupriavidus taiwanensis]|uniref:Uncharacterized protein n=1 Tax=Cupriavidus taiwanensis TaxID=164546 RepID=A0A7Z7JGI0_9BURK|nr:protein of unknown function [Cupriavidus taiwanensis]SPC23345.1 protein of unknown function [Cupriavidus taiwanensis]